MNILNQLKSVCRLLKLQGSKCIIVFALLCFSALWLQATHWYQSYLIEQEQTEIKHRLNQHANELSTLIHQRFALLQGLASFVEADITPQRKITEPAWLRLDTFLSGLFVTSAGIRNFAVAPNGVIEYISPLIGNKKAIGHDLINDPSPNGGGVSRRAIEQRTLVLTAPISLRQGGLGLVARQAIFSDGQVWGLVSMVLDVMAVLRDAGLLEASALGHIALRDSQGVVFFGSERTFNQRAIIERIDLPDGYWDLAVDSIIVKEHSGQKLTVFKVGLAVFFLLLTAIFWVFQSRLINSNKPVQFEQHFEPHEPITPGNPPTWLPPALTATAVISVIIVFYYYMHRTDLNTQQQNLNNTMAAVTDGLQRRLTAHHDYLELIAEQIAFQQLSSPEFQQRVSHYVADHAGLSKVIWTNSEFTIIDTAPYQINKQVVGLTLSLAEPKRVSRLARQLKKAVYSKMFITTQGHAVFEVYVPIFKDNELIGTLAGVYKIDKLLDGLVSDEIRMAYKVQLLTKKGKVIYGGFHEEQTHLAKAAVVSPLQQNILLKLSVYKKNSSDSMMLLLMLSVLLAMGVAVSLLLQYRQSCKFWQTGESLRASQQHFRAIADGAPMAIVICQPRDGTILYANVQAKKLFATQETCLAGDNVQAYYLNRQDYRAMNKEMLRRGYLDNVEVELIKGDQSIFWGGISAHTVDYSQGIAIIISISDLTERKRHEEQLFQKANFDSLTGLPNRGLAFDRLQQTLILARREGGKFALMMLDLDHFKNVNDSFGHDVGDELLQEVARRMTQCIRASDTVARLGGDEFSLLLPELGDAMEAEMIAQKIINACTKPLFIDGHNIRIGVSIGITIYPDDGEHQEVLFKNADIAMYQCKKDGRNHFRFYTKQMNDLAQAKLKIENELHSALESNQFYLHYQPLINAETNEVAGVEALVRWQSPTLGQVSPDDFIPIAESIGIIDKIGQWVLETACAQIKQWRNQKGMPLYVAVNVSANQLRHGALVQVVADVLAKFELPPDALELEITESVLLGNTEKNRNTLTLIHQMGASLAIDDFGTGYSSLSYLRRFPFDTLKIDSSFIEDVPDQLAATQLVSAIISMANTLGLRVVAEGIENQQQFDFIAGCHCQLVQGFYLAKPMSAIELENFIKPI